MKKLVQIHEKKNRSLQYIFYDMDIVYPVYKLTIHIIYTISCTYVYHSVWRMTTV